MTGKGKPRWRSGDKSRWGRWEREEARFKGNKSQKNRHTKPIIFQDIFQTGSEQVLEAYLVWSQFRCMKACGFHGYLVPSNRKVGYKGMN